MDIIDEFGADGFDITLSTVAASDITPVGRLGDLRRAFEPEWAFCCVAELVVEPPIDPLP